MVIIKTKVMAYVGSEGRLFPEVYELERISREQLDIVKQRITTHSKTLLKHEVDGVYFRQSATSLVLEVFICIKHNLREEEKEFWYDFADMFEIGMDQNIFHIRVGDLDLWNITIKRNGWKKFEIIE